MWRRVEKEDFLGRDEREISLRHRKFVKDEVTRRCVFFFLSKTGSGCRYFKLPFILHINVERPSPILETESSDVACGAL